MTPQLHSWRLLWPTLPRGEHPRFRKVCSFRGAMELESEARKRGPAERPHLTKVLFLEFPQPDNTPRWIVPSRPLLHNNHAYLNTRGKNEFIDFMGSRG